MKSTGEQINKYLIKQAQEIDSCLFRVLNDKFWLRRTALSNIENLENPPIKDKYIEKTFNASIILKDAIEDLNKSFYYNSKICKAFDRELKDFCNHLINSKLNLAYKLATTDESDDCLRLGEKPSFDIVSTLFSVVDIYEDSPDMVNIRICIRGIFNAHQYKEEIK